MADGAGSARLLGVLTRSRLVELGRELAVALPASATKEAQVDWLIRTLGVEVLPLCRVVELDVGSPDAPEFLLGRLLAADTALMWPARGRGGLAFISLQKRLLSRSRRSAAPSGTPSA